MFSLGFDKQRARISRLFCFYLTTSLKAFPALNLMFFEALILMDSPVLWIAAGTGFTCRNTERTETDDIYALFHVLLMFSRTELTAFCAASLSRPDPLQLQQPDHLCS